MATFYVLCLRPCLCGQFIGVNLVIYLKNSMSDECQASLQDFSLVISFIVFKSMGTKHGDNKERADPDRQSAKLQVQCFKVSQGLSMVLYHWVFVSTMSTSMHQLQHMKLCKIVNSICFKIKMTLELCLLILFKNLLSLRVQYMKFIWGDPKKLSGPQLVS